MLYRSTYIFFFVILSLFSREIYAEETLPLKLSLEIETIQKDSTGPKEESSLALLEENEIIKSMKIETMILSSMTKEKSEFIRWILPQIHRAREESDDPISKQIPTSVIIAQAALESAWGKSFGAKNRNNLFGLTGRSGQYMIFSSSIDGLKKYILTLGEHRAYEKLRLEIAKTTSWQEIVKHLQSYCNCSGYANKLGRIIESNNLASLD